jgi:hypothetical protein
MARGSCTSSSSYLPDALADRRRAGQLHRAAAALSTAQPAARCGCSRSRAGRGAAVSNGDLGQVSVITNTPWGGRPLAGGTLPDGPGVLGGVAAVRSQAGTGCGQQACAG